MLSKSENPEIQKVYQALLKDDKHASEADSAFIILEDKVYRKTNHPHWGDIYQVYVPQSLHSVVLHVYHDRLIRTTTDDITYQEKDGLDESPFPVHGFKK